MRRFAAPLAILAAALAGCTTTTEVAVPEAAPVDLVGSVLGVVTARSTGLPLAGVQVSAPLPDGQATATTDADGRYLLPGLPAGATHTLRFARAGYVPMTRAVPLLGAGGSISQANIAATADLVMAEATAAVEGRILAGAAAAAGAVATVDLRTGGYDLVVTATTDADGTYLLSGLPASSGGAFLVSVAPLDVDADGVADYLPASAWVNLYGGLTSHLDLALTSAGGGVGPTTLALLDTDLLGGQHDAASPIRFTFDRPVDVVRTTVDLADWTTNRTVATQWETDALGTSLLVSPVGGAPLAPGHEYRVDARVVALDGTTRSYYGTFRAGTGGAPPSPVEGLVAEPAAANWDTRAFTLRWTAVAGADRYEVWIRDTWTNPNYTRITTVGSQPSPAVTISLPSDFDYYTGDGLQTPLVWGTAVEFAVVPLGVAGASSGLVAATPLRVGDTTAPRVSGSWQGGTAENTGAEPSTVSVRLTFDEYMDPAVTPTVALPAPGMSASFAMDPGLRAGTVTVTIPPGLDGSGPITVSGLADTSGNAMAPWTGRLFRQVELLTNGGFEAGSLVGWTGTSSGTAPTPAWTSSGPASGAGAAWLGNQGSSPQSGYSRLVQDFVVPAGAAALNVSLAYRATTTASYGYDDLDCGLYTTAGSLITEVLNTTCTNASGFATASKVGVSVQGGTTLRLQCQVYQWGSYASHVVIDEVSVVVDL